VARLFVGALLTICVGIYALEMSGRWDRTFQDADDEAAVVAVVLCVGIAFSLAHRLLSRDLTAPHPLPLDGVLPGSVQRTPRGRTAITISASSPPLALRV
jgi:hypothetical protein